MNGYRKCMIAEGGNLEWCRPYVTLDGSCAIAVNEGEVVGMILNGEDIDPFRMDDMVLIQQFAKTVNSEYDTYSGWSDLHISIDAMKEVGCADCPWFHVCEAMDNPDGWEDTQAAKKYPDD